MTHRMMMLVIQLGLILFAAKLGNLLFRRLRLPGTLGELVAGVVIGPYALGRLGFYGFPQGLFPMPEGAFAVTPELYGLASVAAIVLLFHVGLETDLKLLLRYCVAGGLVGVGGMLVSFALGAGSVMVFSPMLFGEQLPLTAPECLFLGTITTATSIGITARVLSDRRKLDSPEGVTILSAAVIDDVLGIILLAVVMSIVTASRAVGGIDWGHVGIVGAKAVGVWLAATALGLIASRRISVLLKGFGEQTSIAIMALGLALILAGLFEEAGLAMIIGAYVMGLSLSTADIRYVVVEKITPIYRLLVPVFFCVTGMQINLSALTSPPVLVFGAVYAVVAMSSKLLGCGGPALLAGFNLRGALRIGFGMSPRCEVALIIAGVGLSAGVLSSQILAAVIIMIVVNTVLAPLALDGLFRNDAPGTRKPVPTDAAEVSMPFELPTLSMAEFFLHKVNGVFKSEGFFVHLISHTQSLYQLRKDKAVIDIQQDGPTLLFSCRRSEVPLVNGAMFEALAAVEQAIKGLRQPMDARSIQAGMQQQAAAASTLRMDQYLNTGLIVPSLQATTKAQAIDELLDVLVSVGQVTDRESAARAIWDREESMSTGLQYGVAIPHGKTDAVDRLVCAVGLKHDGIDFDALDGEPSRIFILTLSPASKPAPHVQFMSTVSQVLNADGRRLLLEAHSPREILHVFTRPVGTELPASPPKPAVQGPAGEFRLADYVRPELVITDLASADGEGVIRELVGRLDAAGLLADAQRAAEVVVQRERQMSTGMSDGVAVPHGRTDTVGSLVCAVGVHREGIDFGAADGRPTRIFVLVLTPTGGADPYLQFVASVINVLDGPGRQRVLDARSTDELVAALTSTA
jgi:Kef-type K+ transport system membrane component KefB/mannitol/fructose-specific phosphotransferase system IIA component (Ntr-type)